MIPTILRFENVTKKFDAIVALDGISFNVPENKIVGLIGANGAGKTTSIRHLIRYLKPDSGEILYRDKSIYSFSDTAFPISYIPDSPIFFEELTVMEHLTFIGSIYGTSNNTDTLIHIMEMQSHLDKVPSTLSKGTKQKLMIMCALLREYETLLADEPFIGLDPKQIKVLKELLLEQKRMGRTVLLSTHFLDVIESICDYYIMIDKGRLLAEGDLDDIHKAGKCTSLEELYLFLSNSDNGGTQTANDA